MTLKDTGGKIRQFNLSDEDNLPYAGDYAKQYLEKMNKVPTLDARVLTMEGDFYFPARYCTYRWLRKETKILIPYYVNGDYLAQATSKSGNEREIVSVYSRILAERYIEQFELFWDTAIIPSNSRKPVSRP